MTRSTTLTLAEYAASTSLERIPEDVRERAKQVILDEMASAHFGRAQPAGTLAAQYVAGMAGPPEARVLGTGLRVSAPLAALANGTAGHADEIDGAHVVGGHPGATLVHAAVAMAERQSATGGELLNAVVLGYDIGVRLIEACGGLFGVKERHHLNSDFLHAIAASVASSRLMGLAPERYCHAMALATFQANGLCALFQEKRHISKAFCNGQYAMAGVSAALMAVTGFEGCDDVLGDPHGLFDAWGADGAAETATRGLGKDFAVMGANFKFVRAGYPIHAPVEAALSLVARHAIDTETISAVEVGMPARALRVVDDRRMRNICVQDMLAVALLRGGLLLSESPFPAVLDDPAFAPLRARISVVVNPLLEAQAPNGRGAVVTITTRDGSKVSERVDDPRGHSARGGVTWDELAVKWRDAAPEQDVGSWIVAARKLDDLEHVGRLSSLFTRQP
ncbi:MmgE/PrpD family protein [Streptomyces mirabilis]|jgi:2-methylcitrate dehydratase PrpD|uniref:2-methylcitrate dehydratase PrpD n=1 Tax=Streptomyces mirabilis TaxID=68239 RepID=A0A1I2SIV7_9ACTN|nr:MmgE/PrpD family protein [Streptomyces mirabilis]SFG52734.1 2-methylcitrate dehydratase PrpD [Streptomyces mirabilis]